MATSASAPSGTTSINTSYTNPLVQVPPFVYGTAWKKDRTTELVFEALRTGFKGLDTAAQPRHYREDLVGAAVRKALGDGIIKREDIHIQTKYTPPSGQDPQNLPYSLTDPLETQIRASVASSLKNLDTPPSTYINTLFLHSPLSSLSLTISAWKIMESYVPHPIQALGISNIDLKSLSALYDAVDRKPSVVQNRFYPSTHHDVLIRRFCAQHNIVYQSFWTLSGNPGLLRKPRGSRDVVGEVAQELGTTREVALYLLVMGLGDVSVLNGTTNQGHMRDDLAGLENWSEWNTREGSGARWKGWMDWFKAAIGQERN
ncbi:hypothetical protein MMC07_004850 [Pseudocyphellaria aurata]|nr:hypothetical protein [Pseudocyphellaria aurata]